MTFQHDIGSQYTAEGILCLAFGSLFYLVHRQYPRARGALPMAAGFLSATLGVFVVKARASTSLTVCVVLACGLAWLAFLLFYCGIARSLSLKPRLRFPICVAVLSLLPIAYYASVRPEYAARMLIISVTGCLMQVNLAVDLWRSRRRSAAVRWLTFFAGIFIVCSLLRGIGTLVVSRSAHALQYDPVEGLYTFSGLFRTCALGIFSLALLGRQLISAWDDAPVESADR